VNQSPSVRTVLAGIDDLFFLAKVRSTARALGIRLMEASDPQELIASLEATRPDLIILDLNCAACRPLEFIERIKHDPQHKIVPIVGFLSHVQVQLERAASQAGCDRVLPRSEFSAGLAEILQGSIG
jgi:CheY-like chemotaxis protein